MIENSVSFSGHRPDKLPSKGAMDTSEMKAFTALIYKQIEALIEKGYYRFYCGMAEGFDLICATIIVAFKKKHSHIRLIAAIPFKNQPISYTAENKVIYQNLLDFCDEVITLSENYYRGCYYDRNHFLCDHASYLLCYCKEGKSGTAQTIRYANKHNLQINNLYKINDQLSFDLI